MKLTKQKAIEEHRKMWNWIADQYESNRNSELRVLKREYIKEYTDIEHISCDCFLCEYVFDVMMIEQLVMFKDPVEGCKYCPVTWVNKEEDEHTIKLRCCPCENEDSPYLKAKRAINLKVKSKLAGEIANLPVKEGI